MSSKAVTLNSLFLMVLTLLISACGGGSSAKAGGSSAAASSPLGASQDVSSASQVFSSSSHSLLFSSSAAIIPSSSSAIIASSSVAASQSASVVPPNQVGSDFCSEHTPGFSGLRANNQYEFQATTGNCFGIKSDTYKTKAVPLEVASISDDSKTAAADLKVTSTIKLSSVPNSLGYDFFFTFDLTNAGAVPYCKLRFVEVQLRNTQDAVVLKYSNVHLQGDTYIKGSIFVDDCIAPGKTQLVYASVPGGVDIDLDTVVKVNIGQIKTGASYSSYSLLKSLEFKEALWEDGTASSPYPKFRASFINTLDTALKLEDEDVPVLFLDADGYAVSKNYLWLYEGLGKTKESLVAQDYIIPAKGGLLLLEDSIADIAAVKPTSANRAIVILNWVPSP